MLSLGIIGFGEAGYYITKEFLPGTVKLFAYDSIADEDFIRAKKLRKHADENGVQLVKSLEELVNSAEVIFCLTSASSALAIAEQVSPILKNGQIYVDLNSTSPSTKEAIGDIFDAIPGSFAEAAVMSSVPAGKTKVPILLCGINSEELSKRLNAIGMNTKAVGVNLGVASAMKMLRSILAKGMIAIITETVFCTEHYGITEYVLDGIKKVMLEEMTFEEFCNYSVASAATHNERFCYEMEEVMSTVDSLGENSIMTRATLNKFEWMKKQNYSSYFSERPTTYEEVLSVKKQIEKK